MLYAREIQIAHRVHNSNRLFDLYKFQKYVISESKRRMRSFLAHTVNSTAAKHQLKNCVRNNNRFIAHRHRATVYTLCVWCMDWLCALCIWYTVCRDMDISYFVPVFQSFHEPNVSQLTFLNAYFAIHKSARSFIPRLMLSPSCICLYFQTTECFSECRCKGNDNDNGKVKIIFGSFSSFVSPLIFFHYLSLFIIRYEFRCMCAVYCVTTTNRITKDDEEQYDRWFVMCMPFDSTVSRAMLFLLRMYCEKSVNKVENCMLN